MALEFKREACMHALPCEVAVAKAKAGAEASVRLHASEQLLGNYGALVSGGFCLGADGRHHLLDRR